MALTLGNFVGFETGGWEEGLIVAGTATIIDTFARTGRYCLDCGVNATFNIRPFVGGSDQGDYYVAGFAFRTTDTSPSTDDLIFYAYDGSTAVPWQLFVDMSGYLKIVDNSFTSFTSTTTQLQANTWYYIEISWEQQAVNGQMDIYLDGSAELAITTADFDAGTSMDRYQFRGTLRATHYFDDFYCYSGASSGATDMLGPYTRVLGPFANTEEDATDQGTTLTTGTWANTSEVPFNDSNYAEYDGSDDQGHTRFDEGALLNILDADKQYTKKAHKWISRNDYDGTKTPMYMRWGFEQSAGDWMTNESVTPTKAFVNYEFISTTVIDEDWMSLGHDNAGTGNDVRMSACVGMKLIVQAPSAIATIASLDPRTQNSYGGPFSV